MGLALLVSIAWNMRDRESDGSRDDAVKGTGPGADMLLATGPCPAAGP